MKQGEERLDSGKIIYYTCTFYGVLDGKRHRGRIKRSDFANLRALPHNSRLNDNLGEGHHGSPSTARNFPLGGNNGSRPPARQDVY